MGDFLREKAAKNTAKKRDKPVKDPFDNRAKGTLQLVVSLASQRATLYSNGTAIARAPVSTGTADHPTPTGIFSVLEKSRWHRSNIYDNAPMFYMQRLTWSGVALHQGVLPGYPASHGCIRLSQDFAAQLWAVTRLGVRIVVAQQDLTPRDFDHPHLFHPRPKPTESAAFDDWLGDDGLRSTIAANPELTVGLGGGPAADSETTALIRTARVPLPLGAPSRRTIRPSEPVEPVAPATEPDKPEPVGTAGPAIEADKPPTPQTGPSATEQDTPKPTEPALTEPEKPQPPKVRAAEPVKRNGQVAVFVSRREKKMFVRQGFLPLFETPVEIAQPDLPLGTHVLTAIEYRADAAQMRWNAITVPDEPRTARPDLDKGRRASRRVEAGFQPVIDVTRPLPAPTAAQALDRITIPPEAAERIADLLTPGSSLVISDQGLGTETGRYTDFIVVTR